MFKIILAAGLLLFIITIIILSVLTGIKKIKYKAFWILLPIISCIIILSCGITNNLIANEVSLLSNWNSKTISEETTYSDQIDIYLKEENGKKIIEQVDNTYYFYSDETMNFLGSIYNKFDNITFKVSDKTGFIIKEQTKKFDYEFARYCWFISERDNAVIDKIKNSNKKFPINTKKWHISNNTTSYCQSTELIFFVPKNTLIKTKDKQGIVIYKSIDEFNIEKHPTVTVVKEGVKTE